MGQVSRSTTYTANTVIDHVVHNEEHDNMCAANNDNDDRISAIESDNIAIAGIKSLTHVWKFISGLWSDTIYERSSAAGVTIDPSSNGGVKLKDGAVFLGVIADQAAEDALSVVDGAFWYRDDLERYRGRQNGATISFSTGTASSLPVKYISGAYAPSYSSAASILLPAGLSAKDSTGSYDIVLTDDITLSLAVSGLNGLDTGTEQSSKRYYVYLVKSSTTEEVGAVFSITDESTSGTITLPTGYDLKRQLPIAVINDASSNIIKFFLCGGWPNNPLWKFDVATCGSAGNDVGTTSVLAVITTGATSFTDVDCSAYVPTNASTILIRCAADGSSSVSIRGNGNSHNGETQDHFPVNNTSVVYTELPSDSNQIIEYKVGDAAQDVSLDVMGFRIRTGI